MMTLFSKATHINPITGYVVSDETIMLLGSNVREDGDNYYVSPCYPTDNMAEEVYPKSDWELRD